MRRPLQRWFKTELKHRLKLNDKYRPCNRFKCTFMELYNSPWGKFMERLEQHFMNGGT